MLNQEYLNSINLEDASRKISESLINERIRLRDRKIELESARVKYQDDYIQANDGDARENAPLEQAIQNLKTITGDIVSVTKKSQNLDKIEDSIYVSAVYDYDVLLSDVRMMSPDSIRVLYDVFNIKDISELKDAIIAMSYDDVVKSVLLFDEYWGATMANIIKSEYPADSDVWKSRSMLESVVDQKLDEGVLSSERQVLADFEHIKEMKAIPSYNYCGVIVLYTTVRLDLDGRLFTYKIYPKGLSFIDDGVMAADSRLATALIGRHKGDIVSIRHASKGKILNYKVVDIY